MTAFVAWFTGRRLALLAGGLGVVGALALGHGVVQHIRADAVAQLLLAHDDSLWHLAERRADSVHTVLVTDTLTLARDRVVYRVAHDTVLRHLTDTVAVKQFVAAADTTVRACTMALQDCAQEAAQLRIALAAGHAALAESQALRPTFLQRHVTVLALLAGGVGLYLGHRLK